MAFYIKDIGFDWFKQVSFEIYLTDGNVFMTIWLLIFGEFKPFNFEYEGFFITHFFFQRTTCSKFGDLCETSFLKVFFWANLQILF